MWCLLKVPNQLNMVAAQLLREDRVRYKTARERQILYEAATKLWMSGVHMTTAISIVHKAMKDSGEIWSNPKLSLTSAMKTQRKFDSNWFWFSGKGSINVLFPGPLAWFFQSVILFCSLNNWTQILFFFCRDSRKTWLFSEALFNHTWVVPHNPCQCWLGAPDFEAKSLQPAAGMAKHWPAKHAFLQGGSGRKPIGFWRVDFVLGGVDIRHKTLQYSRTHQD